jgi:trans-aconitate methyltransferase
MNFNTRTMLSMFAVSMTVGSVFAWDSWEFMLPIKSKNTSNICYDIRKFVIDLQGKNKKILDIGCGIGDSTSCGEGSLGIDNKREAIEAATLKYPDKRFKLGVIASWNPPEKYDITTTMFYLHKLDSYKRKQIIHVAKKCAQERVVILDVSPDYTPTEIMIKKKPHLLDFIAESRKELADFTEHTMVEKNISMWTYDIMQNDKNIIDTDTLKNILRVYRPI